MKGKHASEPSLKVTDDIRAATENLGALRKKMAFLVPLTDTERREQRASRAGVKGLRTIASRLEASRQYREHLPPAFDFDNFEVDATRAIALGEMLKVVDELRGAVHDTLLTVSNRAGVSAASVYGYIQVGSKSARQMERTVDKLATRVIRASTEETAAGPGGSPTLTPVKPSAPGEPSAPSVSAPTAQASDVVKADSPTEPTNKAA